VCRFTLLKALSIYNDEVNDRLRAFLIEHGLERADRALEARTGGPSMPRGLWAGARLVGLDASAPGYGRLLSM